MRDNESAITIIALALGLCLTTLLVFGNFTLTYLVKLFAEGHVPAGNALFVFAVTLTNGAVLWFLGRAWLKTIRKTRLESTPVTRPTQRQDTRQRWQEARERVLELAQKGDFTIQDVMNATTFNRSESEYLLDELLHSDLLSVYQEAGDFKYNLKDVSVSNN